MARKRLIPAVFVFLVMGALVWAHSQKDVSSGAQMVEAAQAFLAAISEQQRSHATFAYDDPERLNWHYIPKVRKGVSLTELEGEALAAAHRLIASGLSENGYDQALDVMSLEEVLYLLEGGDRQTRRSRRDPQNYFLTVFGEPSLEGTWGWRTEGHHLSLNYSVSGGDVVASTPEFFGANPGTVDAGPERTIRVLGPEEDIARQILKLCSSEQRRKAWIDRSAPSDLRGGGEAQPQLTPPVGLPVSEMSEDQKQLTKDLLAEYLKNAPADVERRRAEQIDEAGIEKIYFAWWGGAEQNQPHYYRLQGPSFLIEYNNTQNHANHVHSVFRDLHGDFNLPLNRDK